MNSRKFLVLIALLCTGMLAQAQVKLSFNPEQGKTYSYRLGTEQSMKQTVMGQEIPVNTVMDMLMDMTVKEKTNDEISMDYLYKEVVMTVSNPMMNIKYDSKNIAAASSEPEKLMVQIFNSLIGKTMNVTFTTDGSVKSISGFDAIMEDMQKSIASANPAAQPMVSAMVQSLNEDAMKQTFEQSFRVYPNKPVKIGDSWNVDMSFTTAGMTNNMKNTYTLQSVDNGIALLAVLTVSNMKPETDNMTGEMSGEISGEMKLNIKTGMLINQTATGNITGKINTQGMDILMNMASKTTVGLQP